VKILKCIAGNTEIRNEDIRNICEIQDGLESEDEHKKIM